MQRSRGHPVCRDSVCFGGLSVAFRCFSVDVDWSPLEAVCIRSSSGSRDTIHRFRKIIKPKNDILLFFCRSHSLTIKKDSRREGLHSFDLRDAWAHWHECIRFVSGSLRSGRVFLSGGPTSSERGDERGSGEELGLAAIQAEGAIQGEVAVIHSLRGVFLDRLRD